MRTIKLTIAYDGTGFVGWQRQDSGESIQGLIEDALAKIEGNVVTLHGAGRTDAGVHALAQVASARIAAALDDETLTRALNANLPPTIRVNAVETVPDDFHARFSAAGKTYEYRIWNGSAAPPFIRLYTWHVPQPLDVARMNEASRAIAGEHDFAAFQATGSKTHSTVRRVTTAEWRADGPTVTFVISGEGFLRHMVRSLAGTLVEVGHGRRPVEDLARLVESPDRAEAGRTAPPHGLFLVSVLYIEVYFEDVRMSLDQLLAHVPPGSPEDTLARQVNFDRLPAHVAVIMDGNGRWAAQRHLPRVEGHRAGIDSVRDIVETSARLGIQVLTLYAFSVENWKRPAAEVSTLMLLLKRYLRSELSTLLKNDIRFKVVGRMEDLAPDIQTELRDAEAKTAKNHGMLFNIALNYGGRAEIVEAARRVIADGVPPDALDEGKFASYLYTAGQPDPDLLIRTSGEMRVSNFLLWQIAYAEIWVTDTLWPDFRARHLLEAILAYQKRDRRYGGITQPAVAGR